MQSKKPGKQRKKRYYASLHEKQAYLSSHLDSKLGKELKKRALPLRKGDSVKIMKGNFKGKTGKITDVNYVMQYVFIEKILRKKSDGSEIPVKFQPSNLIITDVDRSDARRFSKPKKERKPAPKKKPKSRERLKAKKTTKKKIKKERRRVKVKPKKKKKTTRKQKLLRSKRHKKKLPLKENKQKKTKKGIAKKKVERKNRHKEKSLKRKAKSKKEVKE